MSEKIKEDDPWLIDGGPAFPARAVWHTYKGMSLRDYYAGQALAGLKLGGMSYEMASETAYRVADAMLRAREREGE